eukprot:2992130-Pyramimonas_sp.AAC.1
MLPERLTPRGARTPRAQGGAQTTDTRTWRPCTSHHVGPERTPQKEEPQRVTLERGVGPSHTTRSPKDSRTRRSPKDSYHEGRRAPTTHITTSWNDSSMMAATTTTTT